MPSRPRTKTSTPRLSELARHVVVPSGVVSTGWPSVEQKCAELGVRFRPWQPDVGRVILAKRADGKYASTIGGTGLSIPRQVGKTFLVGAIVFALCLLRPNLTVIWTAHRLRTSEETFKKMLAMSRRKRIAPHMLKPVLGSGEEEIRFRNGSRILFGARERGFGRGFDEVDVLIFDEGQILTENALDDMIPATNQSRQSTGALLLFMGTPPKPKDPGEVWLRMRSEALSGEDEDTGWVEFGSDPGYVPTPPPEPLSEADWKQVAKANPSFPHDTPREAILRMRKKLGPESFLREGMGIYDDLDAPKALPNWPACLNEDAEQPKVEVITLALPTSRKRGSIAGAGFAADATPMLGAIDQRPGAGWMVAEAKRMQADHGVAVVVDPKGPAADLIPALEAAGVTVSKPKSDDIYDACALLFDHVHEGRLRHPGHPELDDSIAALRRRDVGDRFRWWRRDSEDSAMAEAATLALWKLLNPERDETPEIW